MDKKLVLMVEDNLADARLAEELLADAAPNEFELVFATNVGSAIEELSTSDVDAVLLDLGLPDGNGIELVGRILNAAPGAAIIVLTGRSDEELARQALRAGAQDYFLKINMSGFGLARSLRYAMLRHELEGELDLTTMNQCIDELTERVREELAVSSPEAQQRLETILDIVGRLKEKVRAIGQGERIKRDPSP